MKKKISDYTVEQALIDAAKLKDDPNKAQSSRLLAAKFIEVCHGVIDLKIEFQQLQERNKELEAHALKHLAVKTANDSKDVLKALAEKDEK